MNLDKPENKKRGIGIAIWTLLHAALIVAVVLSYPWRIDQSLYSIVPASETTPEIQAADALLSSKTASRIMLFAGDSDFSVAAKAAEEIGVLLKDNPQVKSASWTIPNASMKEISEFLFRERFSLQSPDILGMSDTALSNVLFDKAVSRVYGAFSISSLSRMEEDPYLLTSNAQDRLLAQMMNLSGNLSLRDSFLTVQDSGLTYIFLEAELADSVSAFAEDGHVLAALDLKIQELQKKYPGFRVQKSGVPFHSYSSSKEAKFEVAWISGVSMLVIVLLLLGVFRSPVPILATSASILMAILSAIGATLAVFHEIHVFTFVFGTSVIGVSIDYALHHFAEKEFPFKSILLGFATTELSYIALSIVDFPILRQMAFFSMVGLLSALLSVILVFPKISDRWENRVVFPLGFFKAIIAGYSKVERLPRLFRYTVCTLAVIALIPGFVQLQFQTDLRTLYKPSKELADSELKVMRWMNSGISTSYFVVSGNSEEEVLQKEEALTQKLRAAEKDSLLKSHLAVSDFWHSQKYRKEMHSALSKALPIREAELCRMLKIKPLAKSTEMKDSVSNGEVSFAQLERMKKMLWVGQLGDRYYSAVFPLHVSKDFDIRQYVNPAEGIYAVNKMQEVNAALTELSMTELSLVAFAYFAMFFILSFVYTWRNSLRIVRAPVLACLFTLSVFGYAGIPVNFFAITGLILVLGIGIDYALFFKDCQDHADSTAFVVMLSAMTTLVSFGTLAFSHFAPVSVFGLAVLLGISACFLLSPFTRDS